MMRVCAQCGKPFHDVRLGLVLYDGRWINGGKDCLWRLPGRKEWGLTGRRLDTLPLYGSERARN
jgi:hypothetical protein